MTEGQEISGIVKVVKDAEIELEEPTVIMGFPGPGFVGETTTMLIQDSLKMTEIAHIESELIPPMLVVVGAGTKFPFRIYGDEGLDVLIIVDNQPIPMEHHRTIARELMDWLMERNVGEIVALNGLPMADETLEGSVVGYSTDQLKLADLGRLGVLPLTSGAITGMNAAFLELCQDKGVTFTGLLTPTMSINATNWLGIVSLIEVLNSSVGFDVDTSSFAGIGRREPTSESAGRKKSIFDILRGKK
ncbi:proteasome assembly chaperone family protein [Candidatus Bathyarchaeota archaeon]|nr:proteasome assembly chaperone family protein [Candidatus Bathyarchaeota archaeon]